MDEWDAIFHKDFISEKDRRNYLEFLRNLRKGQAYVELAYMTGILRITREELAYWYDGYHTAAGEGMYNPRSVVCALSGGKDGRGRL